jgi:hypothetical protein
MVAFSKTSNTCRAYSSIKKITEGIKKKNERDVVEGLLLLRNTEGFFYRRVVALNIAKILKNNSPIIFKIENQLAEEANGDADLYNNLSTLEKRVRRVYKSICDESYDLVEKSIAKRIKTIKENNKK